MAYVGPVIEAGCFSCFIVKAMLLWVFLFHSICKCSMYVEELVKDGFQILSFTRVSVKSRNLFVCRYTASDSYQLSVAAPLATKYSIMSVRRWHIVCTTLKKLLQKAQTTRQQCVIGTHHPSPTHTSLPNYHHLHQQYRCYHYHKS